MRPLFLLFLFATLFASCAPVPGMRRHEGVQSASVKAPSPHRATVAVDSTNRIGGSFRGLGSIVARSDESSGNVVADRLLGGRFFAGHRFIDLFGGYEVASSDWGTPLSSDALELPQHDVHTLDGGAEVAVYQSPMVQVKLIGGALMTVERRRKEGTVTVTPDDLSRTPYGYQETENHQQLSIRPLVGVDVYRRFGERVGFGAGLSAQTIRDYSREYDYQYYCGVSESGTQLECEDEPKAFATELVVNPQLRLHVKANDVIAFDAQVWTQVATASAWSTGTVPGGASVGMTVHYGWEDQPKTSAHREHSSAFSSAQ